MYVLVCHVYVCLCIPWLFMCCGFGCFGEDSCCFEVFVLAYLEVAPCWVSWVVWGKVIVGPYR